MTYQIDGETYLIKIEKKKNRNTYIRIKEDMTIYVTTHYLVSEKEILNIIEKNEKAIKKMILKCKGKKEKQEKFYYLGNVYDIIIVPTLDEFDMVKDKIYVKDAKMLERWINRQIRFLFQERYDFYYQKFEENIPKPTLKIRSMTTRWGVCNKKSKTITLNSNLIKYPLECLDYVIVHELSHLVHFDHSKEFWKTVEYYFPEYKKYRKILKD